MASPVTEFREWLGLTQGEFGLATGHARGTVSRWEKGHLDVPEWLAGALVPRRWKRTTALARKDCAALVIEATLAWSNAALPHTARTPLHPRYCLLAAALYPATALTTATLGVLTSNAALATARGDKA